MICKFCGNEIEDAAGYCFVCGQKAAAAEADAPAPQDEPVSVPDASAETAQPLPVAAPGDPADYADVNPADVQKAGKFTRFVCFLFPLIGVIIYMIRAKQGQTGKKHSVADATMSGVCLYLIAAIVVVVMKSMF